MISLFQSYFHMAIAACLVILVTLAVRPFFKRFSNRIACLLWAVVLVRLLCPAPLRLPSLPQKQAPVIGSEAASQGNGVSSEISENINTAADMDHFKENVQKSEYSSGSQTAKEYLQTVHLSTYAQDSQIAKVSERINASKMHENGMDSAPDDLPDVPEGVSAPASQKAAQAATETAAENAPGAASESTSAPNLKEKLKSAWMTAMSALKYLVSRLSALENAFLGTTLGAGILGACGILWLVGMMIFLILGTVKYLRLKRQLAEALPLMKWDGYPVKTSDVSGVPMSFGIFRRTIYVPVSFSDDANCGKTGRESGRKSYSELDKKYGAECNSQAVQCRMILTHEAIHLRHMDPLWKVLAFLALSVHWWNPLVWLFVHCFSRDLEMACDETVLKKLGSSHKKEYAETLLDFAEDNHGITMVAAFGESHAETRIKNVIRYKKTPVWLSAILLAGALTLAGCLATASASDAGLQNSTETEADDQNSKNENTNNAETATENNGIGNNVAGNNGTENTGIENTDPVVEAFDPTELYPPIDDVAGSPYECLVGMEDGKTAIYGRNDKITQYDDLQLFVDGNLYPIDITIFGTDFYEQKLLKGDFDGDGALEYAYLRDTGEGILSVIELSGDATKVYSFTEEMILDSIDLGGILGETSERQYIGGEWTFEESVDNGFVVEATVGSCEKPENVWELCLAAGDVAGKLFYKADGSFEFRDVSFVIRESYKKQLKLASYSVQDLKSVTKLYDPNESREFTADEMSLEDVRIVAQVPEKDVCIYTVYDKDGGISVFRIGDRLCASGDFGIPLYEKTYLFLFDEGIVRQGYALISENDHDCAMNYIYVGEDYTIPSYDCDCTKIAENKEENICLYKYWRYRTDNGYILRIGDQWHVGDDFDYAYEAAIDAGFSNSHESEIAKYSSIKSGDFDGDGRTEYAVVMNDRKLGIAELYDDEYEIFWNGRELVDVNWFDYSMMSPVYDTKYHFYAENDQLLCRFELYADDGKLVQTYQGKVSYKKGRFEMITSPECEEALCSAFNLQKLDIQRKAATVSADELRKVTQDYHQDFDANNVQKGDFVVIAANEEEDACIYGCYGGLWMDAFVLRVKDKVYPVNMIELKHHYFAEDSGDAFLLSADYDDDGEKEFGFYTYLPERVSGYGVGNGNDLFVIDIKNDAARVTWFNGNDYYDLFKQYVADDWSNSFQVFFSEKDGRLFCNLLIFNYDVEERNSFVKKVQIDTEIAYTSDGHLNLKDPVFNVFP